MKGKLSILTKMIVKYNMLFFLCCVVFCVADQFEDDCGLEAAYSTPFVREGKVVQPNQFPWHVAIFHWEDDQFEQICGGSLIRSNLVISAAHCFSDESYSHKINASNYRIVAGIRLSSWTSTEKGRQQSEVREVSLGEEYGGNVRNWQDDISIVQLMTAFTFSDTVRAVCLDLTDMDLYTNQTSPGSVGKLMMPFTFSDTVRAICRDMDLYTNQTSPGSVGKVAGWGLTETNTPSEKLKFLTIPVVRVEECIQKLPSSYKSYFTSDKICAGRNKGSAVCQGDSGGGLVFPLHSTIPPRWYLRGILSNAPSSKSLSNLCLADVFALYTNILKHQTWLSTNMENFRVLPTDEGCRVSGLAGVCRPKSLCPTAEEEAQRGISPQHCLKNPDEICCVEAPCPPLPPSMFSRKSGSKANDYCVDLPKVFFPCQRGFFGWTRGDICNLYSYDRIPGQWMVPVANFKSKSQLYSLVYTSDTILKDFYHFYGILTFLVTDRWLLTTEPDFDHVLRKGGMNLSTPEVLFSIARTVYHPRYLPNNSTAQVIKLIEMDVPVSFGRVFRPICLQTALDSNLTLDGWVEGYREPRHMPVSLLPQEECRRLFPPGTTVGAPDGVTNDHMCVSRTGQICDESAWYHLTANNKQRVACTYVLVGLFLGQTNDTGSCKLLFLRISSIVPWVESVVWP